MSEASLKQRTLKTFSRSWDQVVVFRYLIVGGWNFGFGYAFFVFLYWALCGKIHDAFILVISSVVGITNSFICHRFFTYRSNGSVLKEYFRFYVVYGVQMAINFVLFLFMVRFLGSNPYLTQAILAVLLTVLTYWGHKHYSFGVIKQMSC